MLQKILFYTQIILSSTTVFNIYNNTKCLLSLLLNVLLNVYCLLKIAIKVINFFFKYIKIEEAVLNNFNLIDKHWNSTEEA